jgi:hypothetical protein
MPGARKIPPHPIYRKMHEVHGARPAGGLFFQSTTPHNTLLTTPPPTPPPHPISKNSKKTFKKLLKLKLKKISRPFYYIAWN